MAPVTSNVSHIGTAQRRKVADDRLIAALAGGATIQSAARAARVSRRTAHRRLTDPTFRQQVDEARSRILDRLVDQLGSGALEAVAALRGVLVEPTLDGAGVSVQAARALLGALPALRDQQEFARRLDELERRAGLTGKLQ
jgi:hypothetical protein